MYYVVDCCNVVIDTDQNWDQEASITDRQGGSARDKIIGRPLEAFMVGDATKMFVRSALDAARLLGQTRALPYRCDSVDEHRRFEMVLTPLDKGHVRIDHRLLEARPRASRMPRTTAPASHARPAWRCSQCMSVRFSGHSGWQQINLEPSALLAQDICPTCAHRLFQNRKECQEQRDE